jgi:DNA-binding transcriptional LysR family regulator
MVMLFTHVRTGRWATVMPDKLAEALGLTQQLRSVPIVEPDAVHQIGLVLPSREPATAIVAALVAEVTAVAKTL